MPHASAAALPPGPTAPLDISFSGDALSKLCGFFAEYGDALRVFAPVTQGHMYGHPDHVRHMLINNHQHYTKGIGEHFAMVEMMLHTALLAQHIRPRYLPQHPVELTRQVKLLTKHSLRIPPESRR
jgi:hypothetical protein